MPSSNRRSRAIDQMVNFLQVRGIDQLRVNKNLGVPEYDNDEDPGVGFFYYRTDENVIKKKLGDDPLEVVPIAGGDGEGLSLHEIGGQYHSASSLEDVNSKIDGANLDDRNSKRDPEDHNLAGPAHGSTDLETMSSKITDADLLDANEKNEAGGFAGLTSERKIYESQIPDLNINNTFVVEDQDERLSLNAETGDIAYQQDNETAYIFLGGDPSVDDDWATITISSDTVTSVFGRDGDVNAEAGDYSYSLISGTHGNEDHEDDYIDGVESQDSGDVEENRTTTFNFDRNLIATRTADGEVEVRAELGEGADPSAVQAVARRTS